ncbi:hypothetical protein EVAR_31371_1 [Eumeta japonica]|uniref:Arrestin domain-containing protein 2 n=1 Tax=Eumeta variegata TaxID=151549 RepID=A0A4C1XAJ9_EUMVA|nr:hypothetical protein EVAR_31371_1 [Eumeta japonica]
MRRVRWVLLDVLDVGGGLEEELHTEASGFVDIESVTDSAIKSEKEVELGAGLGSKLERGRPPKGVYRPESVVSGAVKFAIDKDTSYRDITVCLQGKGFCYWSQDTGNSTNFYSGHEEYVNVNKSLLDNQTGEAVLVKKGQYSYPFRFDLPPHIPIVGLSDVTSYLEPIICGERKSLAGIVRCGDGFINVKVIAKNPLLTSGDTAVLDIEVKNSTNTKIKAIKTQLIQNITQISDCGRRNCYSIPVKDANNEIGSIDEKVTTSLISTVQIPERLISLCCKIVVMEYNLRVKFKLPFPHKSFVIAVPVVVREANTTTVAEAVAEDTTEPKTLADVPPPPYWEVMLEDQQIFAKKK